MKNVLAAIVMVVFGGCKQVSNSSDNTVSQPIQIRELDTTKDQYDRYYQIYTLEGCEYIVVSPGNSHFTWGTHKGNCKNSIHKK